MPRTDSTRDTPRRSANVPRSLPCCTVPVSFTPRTVPAKTSARVGSLAEEGLQEDRPPRPRPARLDPRVERAPALAAAPVHLLVRPRGRGDRATLREPVGDEPRQRRVETAPRGRPHVPDRL